MDISFLIPTIRPHDKFLSVVLNNIRSIPTKYTYEICVYGPEKPADKDVVFFEEKERTGQLYGFNHMAKNCNGDYVIIMVDDHHFVNSFDLCIDFLKSDFFKNRKYKITSLNPGDIVCNPVKGQIMGDKPIDFDIPRFSICRFPVLAKSTMNDLLDGVVFPSVLKGSAGDNFLGGFLHKKGETCIDGPTHIRSFQSSKNAPWEIRDCILVREMWRKLFEKNLDLSYNTYLNESEVNQIL
jgi:hypothetical protein